MIQKNSAYKVSFSVGFALAAISAQVSKDGAAFVPATNSATITELTNGCYVLQLTAAEMNADLVVVAGIVTGLDPIVKEIYPESSYTPALATELATAVDVTDAQGVITTAIDNIVIPDPDLSGLALTTDVTTAQGVITDAIAAIPATDLTGLALTTDVTAVQGVITDAIDAIPTTDLTGIATTLDVTTAQGIVTDAIAAIPVTDLTGIATITNVSDAQSAIESALGDIPITDLTGIALTTDVTATQAAIESAIGGIVIPDPDLSGLATATNVTDAQAAIELAIGGIVIPEVDLTGIATSQDVSDVQDVITLQITETSTEILLRIGQLQAVSVVVTGEPVPTPTVNYSLICDAWYAVPFILMGADPDGTYRYTIRNERTDVVFLTQELTATVVPTGMQVTLTFNAPHVPGTFVYDIECVSGGNILPTLVRGQFMVEQDVTRPENWEAP